MQPDRLLSRTRGRTDRGQSVFDYSIGVSLFIVVVLGVLVFVPTAFASFGSDTTGGAADELTAERGADYLTEAVLTGSESASRFRTGCTLLFFEGTTSKPDIGVEPNECGIEQAESLASNLSLASNRPVNVTIEANITGSPEREILCWNHRPDQPDTLIEVGDSDCDAGSSGEDVALTAGSSATTNEEFAAVERVGTLGGRGVFVVVRAW